VSAAKLTMYSIGFTQRTAEEFFGALRDAGWRRSSALQYCGGRDLAIVPHKGSRPAPNDGTLDPALRGVKAKLG